MNMLHYHIPHWRASGKAHLTQKFGPAQFHQLCEMKLKGLKYYFANNNKYKEIINNNNITKSPKDKACAPEAKTSSLSATAPQICKSVSFPDLGMAQS